MLGAALYFAIRNEPGFLEYAGFAAIFLVLVFVLRVTAEPYAAFPQYLVLIWVWFFAGFGYADLRTALVPTHPVSASMERVMVEGWVRETERQGKRERLTIKVHAISELENEELPKTVRLSVNKPTNFLPGRFVRCFATLNPPPAPALKGEYEFMREAYFKGLGAVGYSFGSCRAGSLKSPEAIVERARDYVNSNRTLIAQDVSIRAGRGGGLAAALLTGDRSYLTDAEQDTLRGSGLAHLLAISGLHMGLAGGALYFLFFRALALVSPLSKRYPVQKIAALAALTGVTAYLLLSGASISAQRAYIMVAIAFLAVMLDMPVVSFQTLGLALFAVVLISPNAVSTPGFQMSFAAAGALVRAYSGTGRQNFLKALPIPDWFRNVLGPVFLTSIVAGFATMPFALFHFGRLAPLGILANFCVMPVVTLVCVPLAVLSVFGMMLGIGDIPLRLFGESLHFVLRIAEFFSLGGLSEDGGLAKGLPDLSFILLILALLIWIVSIRTHRAVLVALIGFALLNWLFTPDREVIYSSSQHIAVKTVDGWRVLTLADAGLMPLSFSDLPKVSCKTGCRVVMTETELVVYPDGQAFIETRVGQTTEIPTDESVGISIDHQNNAKFIDLSYRACRPWSNDWPECRG